MGCFRPRERRGEGGAALGERNVLGLGRWPGAGGGGARPGSAEVLGAHHRAFQDLGGWKTQTLAILGEAALKSQDFGIAAVDEKGPGTKPDKLRGGQHGKPCKRRDLKSPRRMV